MAMPRLKVESGIQMIARITKKPAIENFYPNLFNNGPKPGHIIEMISENDTSFLLCDIICESLLPLNLGGKECGVTVFNTDGNINLDILVNVLKKKLASRMNDLSLIDSFLQSCLNNLFLFEIYDATQLQASIQFMESILIKHANISLIIFHTLTAFYWSEQNFKIMKMDIYLKKMLLSIQKVVKDYKVVTLFTRPQYFGSYKHNIENLEPCCEHPLLEKINYRINVVFIDDFTNYTMVQTYNNLHKSSFKILDDTIVWG